MNVAQLFHPDDAAGMWGLYTELISGMRDSVRLEKRYYRKDGTPVWADLSVSLVRHDDGRPRFTVAMIQDITEQYELKERLQFQALHDPLTGLPNRTLFFERLAATLAEAGPDQRVGVCFLDLDGFKAINDTPRPRRRRPAAGRRRAPPRRGRRPPGGPDGRRRVRDPRRGLRRHRARGRGRRERADRRRRAGAGGRPPARAVRLHRRGRAPGGGRHRHRPHEGRRRHALLGQGRGRPGAVGAARPGARRARAGHVGARRRAAGRAGAGRVHGRVPADRGAQRRRRTGGRGARALAAPRARAARARPVHPAGRGDRAHRAAGPVGAGDRVRRRQPVARRVPADPADRQRQPGGAPGRRPGDRRRGRRRARAHRAAARPARARADRERGVRDDRRAGPLAAPARRHRRTAGDRRLRHRLLQPRLPAAAADPGAEAGRSVRHRHPRRRPVGAGRRAGRRRAGAADPRVGAVGDRRVGGDARTRPSGCGSSAATRRRGGTTDARSRRRPSPPAYGGPPRSRSGEFPGVAGHQRGCGVVRDPTGAGGILSGLDATGGTGMASTIGELVAGVDRLGTRGSWEHP